MRISDWSSDVCSSDLVACKLPSMPSHNGTACVQEPFYQPAEVLRIEPVRIFRRCHDVAKKYCQMTSLCRGGVMVRRVQRRDCAQQPLPRSEGQAHVLEVKFRQQLHRKSVR